MHLLYIYIYSNCLGYVPQWRRHTNRMFRIFFQTLPRCSIEWILVPQWPWKAWLCPMLGHAGSIRIAASGTAAHRVQELRDLSLWWLWSNIQPHHLVKVPLNETKLCQCIVNCWHYEPNVKDRVCIKNLHVSAINETHQQIYCQMLTFLWVPTPTGTTSAFWCDLLVLGIPKKCVIKKVPLAVVHPFNTTTHPSKRVCLEKETWEPTF